MCQTQLWKQKYFYNIGTRKLNYFGPQNHLILTTAAEEQMWVVKYFGQFEGEFGLS